MWSPFGTTKKSLEAKESALKLSKKVLNRSNANYITISGMPFGRSGWKFTSVIMFDTDNNSLTRKFEAKSISDIIIQMEAFVKELNEK